MQAPDFHPRILMGQLRDSASSERDQFPGRKLHNHPMTLFTRLLVSIASVSLLHADQNKPVKVFILAGQSNNC